MDYQGDNIRDFFQTNGCQVLQRVENNSSFKYFTENEIRNITDGYKSILGRGAFGVVYKGMLEDRTEVAVKRYIWGTQKQVFAKEVIVHSQINHKNVVRLLGCCTEENALMIVMEFISNGNLSNKLHVTSGNGRVPFPLDKRIEIATDVAEALWCMHSMYSPVLHGDIKPDNILLDENLTPKISDFGIARILCANGPQKASTVIGSIGYLDPAYCESGILTPKSDVYSFGVVLLEVITRKTAVDEGHGTITLAQCFNEALTKGEDMQHMFDEEITTTENMKYLEDIGQLAAKCLQRDVKARPKMVEVATSLRMIRKAMQREQDVLLTAHQFGNLKIFNETEMTKMTKNYTMVFRRTMSECLYSGVIGKKGPVIVRQLKTCSETDKEIFLNTMSMLSQKNHKNVANVVGFHLGKSSLECVYEPYCDLSKTMFGSVSLHIRNLYDTICSMKKLPLHQRLSIAVQCAEGLVHIHSLAGENPDSCGTSLLGNFRSANIFLDKNFVPKIFNVNLATFLGLSIVQKNTVLHIHKNAPEKYYSDPSHVCGQLFNKQSDVYSFGVVLLELITWKTVRYMHHGRARVLTTDFLDFYRRDRNATIEIFGVVCDELGAYFIHEAIAIAIDCLQLDIHMRPEIDHVLFRLQIIAARSKLAAGIPSQRNGLAGLFNSTDKLHRTRISTISMEELNELTRNFSNDVLIAQGPHAKCFLGIHKDGQNFAVKKLDTSENIVVEVPTILRMCYHDNVVQFLGCFLEGETRVLAYEYAPRGSLHDILHGEAQPGSPLSWLQRVKIAVSAAKGIEFLHEKVDPPIIHGNIKSSNILLFDNDVAKIGDIGVSIRRGRYLIETILGPRYYSDLEDLAPELANAGTTYSIKSDVYRFGTVLLELLTGHNVINYIKAHRQQRILLGVSPRLSEYKVEHCIDPKLGGEYPLKAVRKMAAVASLCLNDEPEFRPEMNIVVKALSQLLNIKRSNHHCIDETPGM